MTISLRGYPIIEILTKVSEGKFLAESKLVFRPEAIADLVDGLF